MAEFLLGMNAVIYQGTAAADLASLTEMSRVKDVTVNMESAEADYTSRANSGWRAIASTLRSMTIDFEMVWKPGDSGFDAIRAAFIASSTLELAALDQDRDTVGFDSGEGPQGPKGTFSITSFTKSEALEEAQSVSVSAKLSLFDYWVTDGADPG